MYIYLYYTSTIESLLNNFAEIINSPTNITFLQKSLDHLNSIQEWI